MTAEDYHGHHHSSDMRIRKRSTSRKQHSYFVCPHWCMPQSRWQTNLAAIVVVGVIIIIQLHFSSLRKQRSSGLSLLPGRGGGGLRKPREKWVTTSSQPFNENGLATVAKNLIIVAGHSVTVSGHLEDADHDENDWFLLDYQKHRGLPTAIILHIEAGIQAAIQDPKSLLIFSGGETRAATGPETEGASYYRVADAMNLWSGQQSVAGGGTGGIDPAATSGGDKNSISTVRARTISEEFATDSFENLMFSICRFHEITGSYPNKITMVSFTFKRRRFETMHAAALRWPPNRFSFIGVDPPTTTGFNLEEASKGELENAAKPFEGDPYGCHSPILQQKRQQRNPFSRTPPYALSCPDMKDLLHYCGPEPIALNKIPWKKDKKK